MTETANLAFGDRWRLIGGLMTRLTVELLAPDVSGLRFSQDADIGASVRTLLQAPFLAVMQREGFVKVDGSRLQKSTVDGEINVDVLVPSSDGRFRHNVKAGDFVADATPGLRAALALPPLRASFRGTLTTGRLVEADGVMLPHPVAALAMKVHAWRTLGRHHDGDDVVALLRALDAVPGRLSPAWEHDADLLSARKLLRDGFKQKHLVRQAGWSKAEVDALKGLARRVTRNRLQ